MKNKLLQISSVIFGLLLIHGGLDKFFSFLPVPPDLSFELRQDLAALQEIRWLLPLIGSAEILGGLLLLFPRTRALGALIIFPVMVGVLLTHIFVDPAQLPTALVIWLILAWILFEHRKKYLPILH